MLFFALGAVEARKGAAPAQAEAGLLFVIPGRGLVFAVHNGHVAVAGHEVDIVHGGQIGGREADALARVQGDVLADEVGGHLGRGEGHGGAEIKPLGLVRRRVHEPAHLAHVRTVAVEEALARGVHDLFISPFLNIISPPKMNNSSQ